MQSNRIVVLIVLFASLLFAKKTLSQWVVNVPYGQEKYGYKMFIYNINDPLTAVLDETSGANQTVWTGTGKIKWKMELDSLPGGYSPGDTFLCFGSWDSAYALDTLGYGDNPNHTGFYWLFTDTLDEKRVQSWEPDDTLNVLPKPIVSTTGSGGGNNDTIWVRIPNPPETRRADQTGYDILGYWLWADSTGSGTPNAFNGPNAVEIDFIPIQGGYGDTTEFWQLESDLFTALEHWITYFAYRLVVIPDTTIAENPDCPGYSTHYLSQNSDSIDIYHDVVGVEDNVSFANRNSALRVFPNPFNTGTNIMFSVPTTMPVTIVLYDASGKQIKKILDEVIAAGEHTVRVNGMDENANALPGGVYFYVFKTPNQQEVGKFAIVR